MSSARVVMKRSVISGHAARRAMKNYERHAIEFQELLGTCGTDAGAKSSSGNNGVNVTIEGRKFIVIAHEGGEKVVGRFRSSICQPPAF